MAGVLRILGKESAAHRPVLSAASAAAPGGRGRCVVSGVFGGMFGASNCTFFTFCADTAAKRLTGNTGVIRNFIAPLPRMKLCSIGMSQPRTVFVSGLPHNDAAVYTGTALRGSSLYGRHANSMFPCPNKKTSAADVRHRSKNSCPPAQRDYVPYAGLRVK